MSQIANIVVFDGAAVPVSHTLLPVSVSRLSSDEIVAEYREAAINVPAYAQVRVSLKMQKLKSGVVRVEAKVVVPVMEAILNQNAAGYTAAPKVAYEDTVVTVGMFHERSSIAGRRLARQMCTNIMGNISTSVVPVATGPLPELFDQLVCPT